MTPSTITQSAMQLSAESQQEAIARVMSLMAIPGRSCEESLIANAIVNELKAAGISNEQIFFDNANTRTRGGGQVGNLYLKMPGTITGKYRMLTAHMDTVPICVGSQPIRDGNVIRSADPTTGLGADNRSGVAVLLNTALTIHRDRLPHPPLLFCWFIQEEIGLEGARHLDPETVREVAWACNFDGAVPNRLTIGATSGQRIEITVRGRAAHAGVSPREGISAIVIAAKAIARLHADGWLGLVARPEGNGTANVGVIYGGDATNVVTPEVTLRAESRSHDLAFCHRIADEIIEAFAAAAASVTNDTGACGSVEISRHVDYESFRLADDAPAVRAIAQSVTSMGRQVELSVSNGGLDANWLTRHGVPTVTLGCGQRKIHTAEETLDIEDYLAATQIGLLVALQGAQ